MTNISCIKIDKDYNNQELWINIANDIICLDVLELDMNNMFEIGED